MPRKGTQPQKEFSCFVIGEGSLLIPCVEFLMARGHEVFGVICSNATLSGWAKERGLPHREPTANLVSILDKQPFDYLFSIVNPHILSKEVLELPKKCAINYHDALLPRYAGSHATSWALINRETIHGITWHVMSELVDAGDIMKQSPVDVAASETTLTLSAKCYELAISLFGELVDDLSFDRVRPRKQSLDDRTFFARDKRPAVAGVLSWDREASHMGALVRALDFGPYPNTLGLTKLALDGDFLLVPQVDVLRSVPDAPPGTIVTIDSESIKVSALRGEIVLRTLLTIDGRPLPIPDFVASYGLRAGSQFKSLGHEVACRITELNKSVCKHEAFWVQRLSSLQPATFPDKIDHPSHAGAAAYASLTLPITDEALNFSVGRPENKSVADVLLTAFAIYLARVGGGSQFDIGFSHVQLQRDVTGLRGLFASDVPLRVDTRPDQTFAEVHLAIRREVERVKRSRTYIRDVVARYPVLRASADVQKDLLFPVGVAFVEDADECDVMSADMTLVVQETGTKCRLVYNTVAFDDNRVRRIVQQFNTLVQGAVANPEQCISTLPLLTPEDRHRILVEWNETGVDYGPDVGAHQLFELQVERTPDAVALVFGNEQMTYRELNARSNQLAHYLQKLGVKPEALVGNCMERSIEMMVGILGILKAGGVYVPVDPVYPKERIRFMVEDAQVGVILTQARLVGRLPEIGAQVLCLDTGWAAIAGEAQDKPNSGVTADHLAYVIFTSGSTGHPKGVLVPHRGLVNTSLAQIRMYDLCSDDRLLQWASPSFDASISEIFMALPVGATLYLASQDALLPGPALVRLLRDYAITTATLPPSVLAVLPPAEFPALRTIVSFGEVCPADIAAHWAQNRRFFNGYGPTETSICATLSEGYVAGRNPDIGRPISNTEVYVLDTQFEPVPVGVAGELLIGGAGLARGYLNRPELTAEKFVAHPFSNDQNARLYRTGDSVCYLPNGHLEFLGRLDYQVKIRGLRIEPGEIEAVLRHHPAVREAAVLVREDVPGNKLLVGYLVLHDVDATSVGELRGFLKEKLPDFMVPSAFVYMEALPFTPNGKLDRQALPEPDQGRPELGTTMVEPRDALEGQLTRIWEAVLGHRPIGVRDDFFALGGHSLVAVQLVRQIEEDLGRTLPIIALFEAPTVEQLAEILREECQPVLRSRSVVPLQPHGSKPPFFFLAGQHHFGDRLGPDQPVYRVLYQDLDREQPLVRVEDMAAYSIEGVKTIQPNGPYYLGGFGIGGVVAFEMARQLERQGEVVALLVLCESWAPGSRRSAPDTSPVYRLWQRAQYQLDRARHAGAKRVAVEVITGVKKATQRATWRIRGGPLTRSPQGYSAAALDAVRRYVPQEYSGRITVVRCAERLPWRQDDPLIGWGRLATEGVETHEVPGSHTGIYEEPNVNMLAKTLKHALSRAQVGSVGA